MDFFWYRLTTGVLTFPTVRFYERGGFGVGIHAAALPTGQSEIKGGEVGGNSTHPTIIGWVKARCDVPMITTPARSDGLELMRVSRLLLVLMESNCLVPRRLVTFALMLDASRCETI